MDGKKKNKKKGKKKGKSKKISALEKVKFKLLIETIENKIAWRKEMCEMVKDDVELYQQAYEEDQKDKKEAVKLLEEEIQKQNFMIQNIESALPQAETHKLDTEETKSKEVAVFLGVVNGDIADDTLKLQVLQAKVKMLKTYDADKIERKIAKIDSRIKSDNEDELKRAMEVKKQQEKELDKEMVRIFERKSLQYQEDLKGRPGKNFERVAEETRWWKDSKNILRTMRERLEDSNASKAAILKEDKEELKSRKQDVLETSMKLQEQKSNISSLRTRNKELQHEKEEEQQLQEQKRRLTQQQGSTEHRLTNLKKKFEDSLRRLQQCEKKIHDRECHTVSANKFADNLDEVLNSARSIIEAEVKYSIIKTYDGPPEGKNVLNELDSLLNQETKIIYEQTAQHLSTVST